MSVPFAFKDGANVETAKEFVHFLVAEGWLMHTQPVWHRAMTSTCVCITLLLLVACAPGTDVIYGSSIRLGGGLPSITTMAMGRIGARPAPAAPAAPASPASASPE